MASNAPKVVSTGAKVASQHATYAIHLNAAQAQAISTACEVLARLGIGQIEDALHHLPPRDGGPNEGWADDVQAVRSLMKKHMGQVTGFRMGKSADLANTAWDLHQVVRHRLAWDRNPAGNTCSVSFDPPIKSGPEPLAWMEKTE